MNNFKIFLTEEYHNILLLEAKVDEFANRWMKIHAEHPTVQKNPNVAREMIKHSFSLGQNQDEHMYITKQYLNGILKPKEDDYSVRDTLGMWRKVVQNNLHGGKKLSDFDHDSVQKFFAQFPELRKGVKKAGVSKELQPYHIGKIDHPDYGELDVYHIKQDEVQDEKEYDLFSKAMKTSCTIPGSTVCVQHEGAYVKDYSRGHGFFAYLDKEGTFRLGHGYQDRGIVRHNNEVLDGDEEIDVATQTEKLIKNPAHKVVYKIQIDRPSVLPIKDEEVHGGIKNPYVLKHVLSNEENQKKYLTPKVFKDILFSDNDTSSKLKTIKAGLSLSDEHKNIIKDPSLLERLIDRGQSHILFDIHPNFGQSYSFLKNDLKNKVGLVKPEDYKKKVIEKYMSWSPKKDEKLISTIDNDYDEPEISSHNKEEDIQALLFGNREPFTKDELESMLFHPNFGHQHGKIVSEIFHNSTVRGFDKDTFEPHIEKMIKSDSPHMHLYLLNRPEQWVHDKITPEHVKNMITNADEVHHKFSESRGDYPLSAQIASTILNTKKAEDALTERAKFIDDKDKEHDDIISGIFKSKSKNGMSGYIDSVQEGIKKLSKSELDSLIETGDPRHMRYASEAYEKLSPKSRQALLKTKPDTAYYAVVNMKDIQPHELETFWDSANEYSKKIKSDPNRRSYMTDSGQQAMASLLLKHGNTYSEPGATDHLKLTERIKKEALEHDDPEVVKAALKHVSSPEQYDKIIDKFKINAPTFGIKTTDVDREYKTNVPILLQSIAVNENNSPHLESRHIEKIIENNDLSAFDQHGLKNIFRSSVISPEYLHKLYKTLSVNIDHYSDEPEPPLPESHPLRKLRISGARSEILTNIIKNKNVSDDTIKLALKGTRQQGQDLANKYSFKNYPVGELSPSEQPTLYDKALIPLSENLNIKGENLKELIDQGIKFHPYASTRYSSDNLFSNIALNRNINNDHVKDILKTITPPVFPEGADERLRIKNWSARGKNRLSDTFYKNLFINDSFKKNLDHETFKKLVESTGFMLDNSSTENPSSSHKVTEMFASIGEAPKITKDNISEMMEQTKNNPELQLHLLSHENATPEHVSQFLDHHQEKIKNYKTVPFGLYGHKHSDVVLKEITDTVFGKSGIYRTEDKDFTIDAGPTKIKKDGLDKIKKIINPDHIQTLFDLNPDAFADTILKSGKSSDEHREYFLKQYEKESEEIKTRANLDKDPSIVSYMNSKASFPRILLDDPNLDTKFVDRIHNTTFPSEDHGSILHRTLSHPNLSPELLEKELNHKNFPSVLRPAIIGASNRNLKSPEELSQLVTDYLERDDLSFGRKHHFLRELHIARGNGNYNTQIIKPSHYETISKLHPEELEKMGREYHSDVILDPTLDDKFHAEIQNNPNIADVYKKNFKLIQERQGIERTSSKYNPS